MLFATPRIHAVRLTGEYATPLSEYYEENHEHLAPWEPQRADDYHCVDSWIERCREFEQEQKRGSALRILGIQPAGGQIIGVCSFTNISRGPFQACNLGYSISRVYEGQGLMTEFIAGATQYLFDELDLHRVMASYVPENVRSARVLEKLGFEKEGYAKSYLKIAGQWRDHVLTSKINPRHSEVESDCAGNPAGTIHFI